MTTPEALNALADRVEREEPSRELDDSVWLWVNKSQLFFKGWKYDLEFAPPYTTSVDSAVTLTNWCIVHLSEIGGDGMPMCVLTNGTQEAKGYCLNSPMSGVTALARALASASLRARAADMQESK